MNVNDLVVCGARPVVFLDYIACGRIDETRMHDIMRGIVRGCELAGCSLGRRGDRGDARPVRRRRLRPCGVRRGHRREGCRAPPQGGDPAGDLILGLPSSGIHSNGLSLARKVIPESDAAAWEEMLIPTRIYAAEMKALVEHGRGPRRGAHHRRRTVREPRSASSRTPWRRGSRSTGRFRRSSPKIQAAGGVSDEEMRAVFNLGIGIATDRPSRGLRRPCANRGAGQRVSRSWTSGARSWPA